eukprot:657156-Pelagomonas_calceolata.AAC.1
MASGRLEVSLCLSGKRRGKMHLGRVLFVECSGICRFCKARGQGRRSWLQGLQGLGLQSRSATASLLIKGNQFMKETRKFVVVLGQKSRHTMRFCL